MKIRIALAILVALFAAVAIAALLDPDVRKIDFRRLAGRAGWQLPERVVEALDIQPGDRVADLGAGSGYFVGYLSRAVGPSGRVFAVEVTRRALDDLEEMARVEGLVNVEIVEGATDDPHLADGTIDLVFVCDVYHHIGGQIDYFSRLRADLSSTGRLAIVEPRGRGFASLVSPGGHSTPVDELVAEMTRAGYRLEESFDFLPVQNLLVFRPVSGT